MNSWSRSSVVCPFFIADDGKRIIRCEGPVENTSLDLVFRGKEPMRRHLEGWCSSVKACEKCEIYQMLSEKYR